MKKIISTYGVIVLLVVICSFAFLPLLHAGYFTMHDDEQIGRLQQMYLVLSQGQIPPRWIPDLGFGFGYPLFNFYPPLVYYLGSLVHLVGFSFIDSTKTIMVLGFLLAAGGVFVWTRRHFGMLPAFFAAILYTYAPYHSVDLYVRGALAEFFSWGLIPLVLWSTDMLFVSLRKKYVVVLGVLLALLMLSHSLVMLQLAPLFILYVGFVWWQSKNRAQGMILFFTACCLGLGLSAYFWLPSLLEKQYTLVDTILTKELANYAIHFVCPIQLWSSPWGYGGSVAGCVDGLSFQIGKIQGVVGAMGILLSILFMFKKNLTSFAVSILFLCSIFFTLPYSKFLWEAARPFWYIQFPWRYLLFVALTSSFLGAFVLFVIEKKIGKWAALVVGVVLSVLCIYQVRNYFHPQSYRDVADKDVTSPYALKWYVSRLSYEYVPKDVATEKSNQGTTQLAIGTDNLPQNPFSVINGRMDVAVDENISYLKKFRLHVYNQGIFRINTYNFPGWSITINGVQDKKLVRNPLDLIQIELPAGDYTVVANLHNTVVQTVANSISMLVVVGLFGFLVYKRFNV